MKRYAKDNRPKLRPVDKVELSSKHIMPRAVAVIILALLGAGLLAYSAVSCLSSKSGGWREIETGSAAEANCSSEFVFQYNIGASNVSASAEYKKLSSLYTELCQKASRIFSETGIYPDLGNVGELNRSHGESVELDETLYRALKLMADSGRRDIYLAPVWDNYSSLFNSTDDNEAAVYDPQKNDGAAEFTASICNFAADPESVNIELYEDNKAKLVVSDEYASFAEEYGIETFVSFGWMKNAFIADYLAENISDAGYTFGTISSYDGFCRNLCNEDVSFNFNIYSCKGGVIYPTSKMVYSGERSIVLMRSYPINSLDTLHYYSYEDGEIVSPYIGASGIPQSSIDTLTCSSAGLGCGEILVCMMPVYMTDEFDADAATALEERGICSVWCSDNAVFYTDDTVDFAELYSDGSIEYKTQKYGD